MALLSCQYGIRKAMDMASENMPFSTQNRVKNGGHKFNTVFENHAKKVSFYSTIKIKVKLLSGTYLVK